MRSRGVGSSKASANRLKSAGLPPVLLASAEVLEAFYRDLFLPLVWRATWRHGLSKEDARDVVQEAFLLAMVKMSGDGNPRGWLFQVVDNLCVSHQRKTLRRARLTAKWGFDGLVKADSADDPEEEVSD